MPQEPHFSFSLRGHRKTKIFPLTSVFVGRSLRVLIHHFQTASRFLHPRIMDDSVNDGKHMPADRAYKSPAFHFWQGLSKRHRAQIRAPHKPKRVHNPRKMKAPAIFATKLRQSCVRDYIVDVKTMSRCTNRAIPSLAGNPPAVGDVVRDYYCVRFRPDLFGRVARYWLGHFFHIVFLIR